jgi:ATP-dependent Clp protease ATP-binding subunit ClpA
MLLKPLLARGELRCIGATTTDKFRRFIEKDPALERRFQQVPLVQNTLAEAISIVRGLRKRYEVSSVVPCCACVCAWVGGPCGRPYSTCRLCKG